MLLDGFGLDSFLDLHLLFLNGLLDLLDMMQLLLELLLLLPLPVYQLRLSLLLVAMANGHLGQLSLRLHLARNGLGCLKINDPVFEFLNVLLTWIVGMPGLRGDDRWHFRVFVAMPSLIRRVPYIINCVEIEVSGDFVVVDLLGELRDCLFESVGVERSAGAIVIIGDNEILLETLSDLLVMDPRLGLEQPRDVDILGPLLLILLALEALHLDQLAHFNFDN